MLDLTRGTLKHVMQWKSVWQSVSYSKPYLQRHLHNTSAWLWILLVHFIIICPIATAYSMGQIIKSVCICQCVCLSASTLTVAFLNQFSQKLAQT